MLMRLEQQIVSLKEKEKTLHNKNSELQHRLIDVEGKLEVSLNGQRANTDQVSWSLKLLEVLYTMHHVLCCHCALVLHPSYCLELVLFNCVLMRGSL